MLLVDSGERRFDHDWDHHHISSHTLWVSHNMGLPSRFYTLLHPPIILQWCWMVAYLLCWRGLLLCWHWRQGQGHLSSEYIVIKRYLKHTFDILLRSSRWEVMRGEGDKLKARSTMFVTVDPIQTPLTIVILLFWDKNITEIFVDYHT